MRRKPRTRRVLASLAAAALLLACTPSPRPSFVLVTLDTTRPDHLGPYASEKAHTPHLDRLAARGRTYMNAYATSSWTLPSHASIFTGLWPFEHGAGAGVAGQAGSGQQIRPLGNEFETLAELLAGAGYRTAAVVAGPALSPELGVAQGFEVYHAEVGGLRYFTGRRAEWVADQAIAQVESFGVEPYFLFVNFFDPHSPYRPPPPWSDALPVTDHEEISRSILERHLLPRGDAPPLDAAVREALAGIQVGYDAEIAYMDGHLGRLIAAIEASPQADRTWLVVTSDHGESFGEHSYVIHGLHLYEDNVRVPLLVLQPENAGREEKIDAPVQNHRLFGTILRAAGVRAPPGADARPLGEGPVVAAGPLAQLAAQLPPWHSDPELRAFYRPPHKLITTPHGETELYDLSRDPDERENLAPERPELVQEMLSALEQLERRHPARFDEKQVAPLPPETQEALRAMGYLD